MRGIPEIAQDIWEEQLKRDLFRANADGRDLRLRIGRRLLRRSTLDRVDCDAIKKGRRELEIAPQRVHRIVLAACADVDWHGAIGDMVRHGMTQDHAEEVLERIIAQRWVAQVREDLPYERSHKRRQLWGALAGLAGIALAAGLANHYWWWFSDVATWLQACGDL